MNPPEYNEDDAKWLLALLPKAAHGKIPAILDYFSTPEQIDAVGIIGARVPIEHAEVYGLRIGVDANGNAATVEFPYGAHVTESVE